MTSSLLTQWSVLHPLPAWPINTSDRADLSLLALSFTVLLLQWSLLFGLYSWFPSSPSPLGELPTDVLAPPDLPSIIVLNNYLYYDNSQVYISSPDPFLSSKASP